MHFAQLNIFQRKMYAEHFPLENVRQNAFWHQMHFCIKCICNILLMRCKNAFVTFCVTNAFLQRKTKCTHQMHFCTALLNIFLWKMYALQKCIFASNAFWHQMHFGIKCILASNAFLHQMHLMQKCIFATHSLCFLQSKKHSILPLSNIL